MFKAKVGYRIWAHLWGQGEDWKIKKRGEREGMRQRRRKEEKSKPNQTREVISCIPLIV